MYPLLTKKPKYPLLKKKYPLLKKRYPVLVKKSLREKLEKPVTNKDIAKWAGVSEKVFRVLQAWESRGFLVSDSKTKTYKETLLRVNRLIKGSLFNEFSRYDKYKGTKFSVEEIIKVFDKFSVMCSDDAYEPANKEILKGFRNLSAFILTGYPEKFSKFIWCLENDLEEVVQDKYPDITKILMARYVKEILGGIGKPPKKKFFVLGAIKLMEFANKNQLQQKSSFPVTQRNLANWLFEAVQESCYKSPPTPAFFHTNYTFNVRFPAYLVQQGIVDDQQYKLPKDF